MEKIIKSIRKYNDEILVLNRCIPDFEIISISLKDKKNIESLGNNNMGDKFTSTVPYEIKDPVYFFYFKWEFIYEHWIKDTIFLLDGYLELRKMIPNLKLLRPIVDKKPFHMDTLKLLFGGELNDILVELPEFNKDYLIKKMYLPFLRKNYQHKITKERINIYNKLIEKAKPFSKNDYPKKIYLSRRNLKNHYHKRILINEDEIAELMIQNGYTEIFSNELSFADEINLFNNVEKVVTPIGSGCSNIVFSNNKSNWIIIATEDFTLNNSVEMWKKINNNIFYFRDTTINEVGTDDPANSSYTCNVHSLEQFLQEKGFFL